MKVLYLPTLGLNIATIFLACFISNSNEFKLTNYINADSGEFRGERHTRDITGVDGYFCKEFKLFCNGNDQTLNIQVALDISDDVQTYFNDFAANSNSILAFLSLIEQDDKFKDDENLLAAKKAFGSALQLFDGVTFDTEVELQTAMNKSDEYFNTVIEKLNALRPKLNKEQLASLETALANLKTLRLTFKQVGDNIVKTTYTIIVTFTLTTEKKNSISSIETSLQQLSEILKKLQKSENIKDKSQIEKLQSQFDTIITELTQTQFSTEEQLQAALKKSVTSINSIITQVNELIKSGSYTGDDETNLKTIITIITSLSTEYKQFEVSGIEFESTETNTDDSCKVLDLNCDSNGNIEIHSSFGFKIPKSVNEYFSEIEVFLNIFLKFWSSLKRSGKVSDQESFDAGLTAFKKLVELFANQTFTSEKEFDTTLEEAKKQQQIILNATKKLQSGLSSTDEALRVDLEKQLGLLISSIEKIKTKYEIDITFEISTEQRESVKTIQVLLRKLFVTLRTLRNSTSNEKTREELKKIMITITKVVELLTKTEFKTEEEFKSVLKQVVVELNSISKDISSLKSSSDLTETEKTELSQALGYIIAFKKPFKDFDVEGITEPEPEPGKGNTAELCKELGISCDNETVSIKISFSFEETESIKLYFSQLKISISKVLQFLVNIKESSTNKETLDAIKKSLTIIIKLFNEKKFETVEELKTALTEAEKEFKTITENAEKLQSGEDEVNLKALIASLKTLSETSKVVVTGGEETNSSFTIRISFSVSSETNKTITSIETNLRNILIRITLMIKKASGKDKEQLEKLKLQIEQIIENLSKTEFKTEEELKTELTKTVTEVNEVGTELNNIAKSGDNTQKEDLDALLAFLASLKSNYKDLGVKDVETTTKKIEIVLKFEASEETVTNVKEATKILNEITTTLETLKSDKQLENNEQFKSIVNIFESITTENTNFTSQEELKAWLEKVGSKLNNSFTDIDTIIKSGSFSGETLTKLENFRKILISITKSFRNLGINLSEPSESTKPTESTETSESTKPTESNEPSDATKPTEPTTTSHPTGRTEEIVLVFEANETTITIVKEINDIFEDTKTITETLEKDKELENNEQFKKIFETLKTIFDNKKNFTSQETLIEWLTKTGSTIIEVSNEVDKLIKSGSFTEETKTNLEKLRKTLTLIIKPLKNLGITIDDGKPKPEEKITLNYEVSEKTQKTVSDINVDLEHISKHLRDLENDKDLENNKEIEEIIKKFQLVITNLQTSYKSEEELKSGLQKSVEEINDLTEKISKLVDSGTVKDKGLEYLKFILTRTNDLSEQYKNIDVTGLIVRKSEWGGIEVDFPNASPDVTGAVKSLNTELTKIVQSLNTLQKSENKEVREIVTNVFRIVTTISKKYTSEDDLKKDLESVKSEIEKAFDSIDTVLKSEKISSSEKQTLENLKNSITLLVNPFKDFGITIKLNGLTEPVTPTNEPVTPTNEPVTPTNEPITPTNEPVTPTNEPVTPTNEPVTPTNEPVTPTNEPVTPTNEPVTATNEPVTPTRDLCKEIEISCDNGTASIETSFGYETDETVKSYFSQLSIFLNKIIQFLAKLDKKDLDNSNTQAIIKALKVIIKLYNEKKFENEEELKTALTEANKEIQIITENTEKLEPDLSSEEIATLKTITTILQEITKTAETIERGSTTRPTNEPVTPTNEPVTPTNEPVTPTNEPVTPTNEPVTPTNEPVTPTNEPVTPTNEPVTPTNEPVTPIVLPTDKPTRDLCKEIEISCDNGTASIETSFGYETNESVKSYFSQLSIFLNTIIRFLANLDEKDLDNPNTKTIINALKVIIKLYNEKKFENEEELKTALTEANKEIQIITENTEKLEPDLSSEEKVTLKTITTILQEITKIAETIERGSTTRPTNEPVTPTNEPVTPTNEPVTPTNEPVTPTNEPVTPTNEPVTPTNEPVTPTNEPVTPTNEPVTPTNEPVTPIVLPTDKPTRDLCKEIEISCDSGTASIETSFGYETDESVKSYFSQLSIFLNTIIRFLANLDEKLLDNPNTKTIINALKVIIKLYNEKKFENEEELKKAFTEANKEIQVIIENTKKLESDLSSEEKATLKTITTILQEITETAETGGLTIKISFETSEETTKEITSIENNLRTFLIKINLLLKNASGKDKQQLEEIKSTIEKVIKSLTETTFKTKVELDAALTKAVTEINSAAKETNEVVKSSNLDETQKKELDVLLETLKKIGENFEKLGVKGVEVPPVTRKVEIDLKFEANETTKTNVVEINTIFKDTKTITDTLEKDKQLENNEEFKKIYETLKKIYDDKKDFTSQDALIEWLEKTGTTFIEVSNEVEKLIKSGSFTGETKTNLEKLRKTLTLIIKPLKKLNVDVTQVKEKITLDYKASEKTQKTVSDINVNLEHISKHLRDLENDKDLKNNKEIEEITKQFQLVLRNLQINYKSEEELKSGLEKSVKEINDLTEKISKLVESGTIKDKGLEFLKFIISRTNDLSKQYENIGVTSVIIVRKNEWGGIEVNFPNASPNVTEAVKSLNTELTKIVQFLNTLEKSKNEEISKIVKILFKVVTTVSKKYTSEADLKKDLESVKSEIEKAFDSIVTVLKSDKISSSEKQTLENLRNTITLLVNPLKNLGITLKFKPTPEGKIKLDYKASEKTEEAVSQINIDLEDISKQLQDLEDDRDLKNNKEIEKIRKDLKLVIKTLEKTYKTNAELQSALEKSVKKINDVTATITKLTESGKITEKGLEYLKNIIQRTNDLSTQYTTIGVTGLIVRKSESTEGIEINISDADQQLKDAVKSINIALNKIRSFEKTVNNSQNKDIQEIITTIGNLWYLLTKKTYTSETDLKNDLYLSMPFIYKIYLKIKSLSNSTNLNANEKQNLEKLKDALESLIQPYEKIGQPIDFEHIGGEITIDYDASPETEKDIESINEDLEAIALHLVDLLDIKELRNNKEVQSIILRYHEVIKTLRVEYDSPTELETALKKAVKEINDITNDIDSINSCESVKGNGLKLLVLILIRTNELSEPFEDLGAPGLIVRDVKPDNSSSRIETNFNTTFTEKHNIDKINNAITTIVAVLDKIQKDSDLKNNKDVTNIATLIQNILKELNGKFQTKEDLKKRLTATVTRINQVITEIYKLIKSDKTSKEAKQVLRQFLRILLRIGKYYKVLGVEGVKDEDDQTEGRIITKYVLQKKENRAIVNINANTRRINLAWERILSKPNLKNNKDVTEIGKIIDTIMKTLGRQFQSKNELDTALKSTVTQINLVISKIRKLINSDVTDDDDERYLKIILRRFLNLERWYKVLGVTGIVEINRKIVLKFNATRDIDSSVETINSLLEQGQRYVTILRKDSSNRIRIQMRRISKQINQLVEDLGEKEYNSEADLKKRLTDSVTSVNAIISAIDKVLTSGNVKGTDRIYLSLLLNVFTSLNEPYLKIGAKGIDTDTDYCPCSRRKN